MRPDESGFDHLSTLMPGRMPEAVRAQLGRFGFSQEKAFVAVGELSGGERARLNLALVTHEAPALLILDEPTNHLDLETREALVRAINDFAGAVVVVSHDRHLLELVADRLWLVANGTVRPFDGDLDDYEHQVLDSGGSGRVSRSGEDREPSRDLRGDPRGDPGRDARRRARRLAAERRRELEPLRRIARRAEERIAKLTEERDALDRVLARPSGSHAMPETLAGSLKRRAELARLIAAAENEWLAAEESIEREGE
jgi:ATP-binding cassette subfamily F protein 3